jgi:hypothetical protein
MLGLQQLQQGEGVWGGGVSDRMMHQQHSQIPAVVPRF